MKLHKYTLLTALILPVLCSQPTQAQNTQEEKNKSLVQTIREGEFAQAIKQMEEGAELKRVDESVAYFLLRAAIQAENATITGQLLERYGIPEIPSMYDRDYLAPDAVELGNPEILELLLKHKAGLRSFNDRNMIPLMIASEKGDLTIMKMLLDAGAQTDNTTDAFWHYTPLYYAAKENHIEAVKLLLDNGALIKPIRRMNEYPIHIAAENGNLEIVQLLVDRGCDPGINSSRSFTPLMIAAANGRTEMVRLLIKLNRIPDPTYEYGRAAFSATRAGHLDALELLFEAMGMPWNPDEYLAEAIRGGHPATVAFWIDNGADMYKFNRYQGTTLLMSAALLGHLDVVKLLVSRGADMNARDSEQNTILMYAAVGDHPDVIAYLLEKGGDLNAIDYKGSNALALAAYWGGLQSAKLLIEQGMDVNIQNRHKQTPLLITLARMPDEMNDDVGFTELSRQRYEIAKLFIDNGANVNAPDLDGATPLMYATANNYEDAARLLQEKGAKTSSATIVWQYEKDDRLLEAVIKHDYETVKKALAEGADVNTARDMEGSRPIVHALQVGAPVRLLKLLVENGAWVNACNYNSTTPLMRAVMANDHETARYFIEKGANVHAANDYNNTAMIFAAKTGDLKMIRLLADYGAKVNMKANAGNTPLGVARQYERIEAMELLKELGAVDEE